MDGLDEYDLPTATPVYDDTWAEVALDTDLINNLKGRILSLKAISLAGAMVTYDVVQHRISPLRDRPRLAYWYYSNNDVAQIFPGGKFLFLYIFSGLHLKLGSPLTSISYT